METIKLIDLLIETNNFNNGKAAVLPNKIKYNTRFYYLKGNIFDENFHYENSHHKTLMAEIDDFTQLNEEVEIIEADKEIEKLDIRDDGNTITLFNDKEWTILNNVDVLFGNKINELIDKVKNMENNK